MFRHRGRKRATERVLNFWLCGCEKIRFARVRLAHGVFEGRGF